MKGQARNFLETELISKDTTFVDYQFFCIERSFT